jgi:hypothetical protein
MQRRECGQGKPCPALLSLQQQERSKESAGKQAANPAKPAALLKGSFADF